MKNGPAIPGWAVGLALAVFLIALVGFGYKYVMGPGPLDPSSLPPEQQKNPYLNSDFGKKFQQQHDQQGSAPRPVNPHQ